MFLNPLAPPFTNPRTIELLGKTIDGPTALISGLFYLCFIVWWVIIILFCFAVKRYRFIISTFYKGLKGNTLKMFLCGLGIGFFMNFICILGAIFHKDIYLYYDSFKILPVLFMLVCVFIQCAAEEMLYRGFGYQALRRAYKNPWVAIIVPSFVFAIGHLANPGMTLLAFLNIIIAGILFSLIVYYFDSFWAAMAAHTAWNFTQNVIFGLPNSGLVLDFSIFKLDAAKATDSFFYSVAFGIEGTGMACLVLGLSCVVVILLGRKRVK